MLKFIIKYFNKELFNKFFPVNDLMNYSPNNIVEVIYLIINRYFYLGYNYLITFIVYWIEIYFKIKILNIYWE